ncbi:MAG TPA: hypothetical protein VIG24_03790 [Acidimicrobiia bacterium]
MADESLSREEWLRRCATEYKRLAETDDRFAMECAEATLGALDDGLLADPEEAAREDMSYWSD